jgi:hypothetical protein
MNVFGAEVTRRARARRWGQILSPGASWPSGTLHLTDFVYCLEAFAGAGRRGGFFVSKIAATVLALGCTLFAIPMSAQLIPHGNVYVGGALSRTEFVIPTNQYHLKGFEASGEALPFARAHYLGIVLDGSGVYGHGVTQYSFVGGPRLSVTYGKWRPFVQGMAGIQMIQSSGNTYNPLAVDVGGGVDYKLFFKKFAWRVQGDYIRTRYLSDIQNNYRGSTGLVWRF